ncbi:MAG TPA: hypothetical protein PKW95_07495 [bacterium]|nr:hypothetical protein [bacterium]
MAEREAVLSIPILALLFFLLVLPAADDPGAPFTSASNTSFNVCVDQAPGVTLTTMPVIAVARLLTADAVRQRHLARMLTLTLLVLIAGVMLFRLLPAWGVNDGLRLIAVGAFCVSTFAWASFTSLSGPGFAAALVLIGVLLLIDYRRQPSLKTAAQSGLCFGLAIVFDYAVVALALPALAYFVSVERHAVRVSTFVATSLLLPAAIVAPHNLIVFGEPLPAGLFAWSAPTAATFEQLLIRPAKGMFFWSPVLHVGLIGMILMIRHRRREGLLLAGMFLALTTVVAGRAGVVDEAGFGPQRLALLIGPLIVAAAWLASLTGAYGRGIFAGLAVGSSLLAAIGVTVAPAMPGRIANPLWEFALPLLRENIGAAQAFGLSVRGGFWLMLALVVALWLVILWYAEKNHEKPDRRFHRGLGATLALACVFYAGASPLLATTEESVLHRVKGEYFMAQQAYPRAADEFARSAAVHADPWTLYYLARAYYLSGREAEGDAALQRMLAIDPTFQKGDEP